jgi:predicted phosphodiesterase
MIWVTGDLHDQYDTMWKFDTKHFANKVKEEDYIIICGDFGLIWDGSEGEQQYLDIFNNRTGTYLFVDGNHENFPLINSYPTEQWNGGLIHRIRPSIIHLMRGQIYTIEGKKIFVMGGGTSVDREWRIEGVSWWPREMPTDDEYNTALKNLDEYDWKVDYVCTHVAPDHIHDALLRLYHYKPHDKLTNFLQVVDDRLDYKMWYLGHYHEDGKVDDKHYELYRTIVPIEEEHDEIFEYTSL